MALSLLSDEPRHLNQWYNTYTDTQEKECPAKKLVEIISDTIPPVVIEILTRMSYIISVGKNLGLGFSG
jgi:hypothetical protein